MTLLMPITVIVGVAILLVTIGDCVNLAFADAQAAHCGIQADCPFSGGSQLDTCCKSPVSPAKYIQSGQQKSLSQPSVSLVDFPRETFAGPVLEIARRFSGGVTLHAPPGGLNALFI